MDLAGAENPGKESPSAGHWNDTEGERKTDKYSWVLRSTNFFRQSILFAVMIFLIFCFPPWKEKPNLNLFSSSLSSSSLSRFFASFSVTIGSCGISGEFYFFSSPLVTDDRGGVGFELFCFIFLRLSSSSADSLELGTFFGITTLD